MWHLYKPSRPPKFWPGSQGGVREGHNLSRIGQICLQSSPLNGSRVPKIDSNLSGAVGGTIWGPFQDYLNHSGASGGLRSHVWGRFWRSVPLAANLVKILWIRMAFTCVRHIVLLFMFNSHLLGHFRPSKERWNRALQLGENYHFFGGDFQFLWGDYHFWGPIPLLAATIYWG